MNLAKKPKQDPEHNNAEVQARDGFKIMGLMSAETPSIKLRKKK